jgi:hypothetical protein
MGTESFALVQFKVFFMKDTSLLLCSVIEQHLLDTNAGKQLS